MGLNEAVHMYTPGVWWSRIICNTPGCLQKMHRIFVWQRVDAPRGTSNNGRPDRVAARVLISNVAGLERPSRCSTDVVRGGGRGKRRTVSRLNPWPAVKTIIFYAHATSGLIPTVSSLGLARCSTRRIAVDNMAGVGHAFSSAGHIVRPDTTRIVQAHLT